MNSTPILAPLPVPTIIATGVARPRAHGQDITKTEIAYRDSIVIEKVPVEVEVEKKVYPKTYWWLLGFFVITLGIVIVKIYLRFKK